MTRTTVRAVTSLTMGLVGLVAYGLDVEPSMAQQPESLRVDVGRCVGISAAEERLRCFDGLVERARRDSGSAAAAAESRERQAPAATVARREAPTAAAAEAAPRASERADARATRRRDGRDDGGDSSAAEAAADIVAKVAELRETVPNSYVITLDNGQVWRQTRPMAYPLRPGTEVRIYESRWGDAYRLSGAALGGFIQVERVR